MVVLYLKVLKYNFMCKVTYNKNIALHGVIHKEFSGQQTHEFLNNNFYHRTTPSRRIPATMCFRARSQ